MSYLFEKNFMREGETFSQSASTWLGANREQLRTEILCSLSSLPLFVEKIIPKEAECKYHVQSSCIAAGRTAPLPPLSLLSSHHVKKLEIYLSNYFVFLTIVAIAMILPRTDISFVCRSISPRLSIDARFFARIHTGKQIDRIGEYRERPLIREPYFFLILDESQKDHTPFSSGQRSAYKEKYLLNILGFNSHYKTILSLDPETAFALAISRISYIYAGLREG